MDQEIAQVVGLGGATDFSLWKLFLRADWVVKSVIILLIDQPDLGQSILLIGSWIATVFVSGVSLIYIFSFFIIVRKS